MRGGLLVEDAAVGNSLWSTLPMWRPKTGDSRRQPSIRPPAPDTLQSPLDWRVSTTAFTGRLPVRFHSPWPVWTTSVGGPPPLAPPHWPRRHTGRPFDPSLGQSRCRCRHLEWDEPPEWARAGACPTERRPVQDPEQTRCTTGPELVPQLLPLLPSTHSPAGGSGGPGGWGLRVGGAFSRVSRSSCENGGGSGPTRPPLARLPALTCPTRGRGREGGREGGREL